MKKIIFSLFILISSNILCVGQESNFKDSTSKNNPVELSSNVAFPELTPQGIDNLDLLGRIWGFLKYHHPNISKGDFDWDKELFQMLPGYLKVTDNKQRDAYLVKWIQKFGKIPVNKNVKPVDTNAVLKPDLTWINPGIMSPKLYNLLMKVYQNRNNGLYYVSFSSLWVKAANFTHEKNYAEMEYPDSGLQLLALYRYWNMVYYFFPYKSLMDADWNVVMKNEIPSFISATDKKSYYRAVKHLIAQIDDTHGVVWNAKPTKSLDYYRPPFRVSFLKNDTLVVSSYWDSNKIDNSGPHIGDIITHIDGRPVSFWIDSLAPYYAASNHQVKLQQLSWEICCGDKPSVSISFISDGFPKEAIITRYNIDEMGYHFQTDSICYKTLDDSIGYVSMDDITEAWVKRIADTLHSTKGLILDLREYPNETINYKFYAILSDKSRPFFKATEANMSNPGEFTFSKPVYAGKGKQAYPGKIAILINEKTQSHAEFCTMMYRTLPNSIVIGNTTSGADGNVVKIQLPGGVNSYFSGIGIYYPDGTGTQRVGIIPDIYVWPTAKGIREGRDEILEKAIEWLGE